jgi:toxin ParE2
MKRFIFHPRFKRDAHAVARRYEDEQEGLGADFRAEVERALALVAEYPLAGALIDEEVRRQQVRRFPYHVLYHVGEDVVFVMSVAHQHRRPGHWRRRLP